LGPTYPQKEKSPWEKQGPRPQKVEKKFGAEEKGARYENRRRKRKKKGATPVASKKREIKVVIRLSEKTTRRFDEGKRGLPQETT